MSLPTLDDNLNIIQQLDDEPNDVGGLTAAELKAKFDQGGKAIQTYLNEVLLPALEAAGVLDLLRTADSAVQYIRLNSDDVIEVSANGETWIATASSGHIILDPDGNQMPQRARMRFTNSEVTDNGIETVVHGIKGDKGDKGDQGDQGIQGIQGERGLTGPVIVPSIDANGVMSFTIQDTAIAPGSISVRGPQGPQGVQGAQGAQGERGPQGIQGVQGAQGIQGLQGETGPAGPAGPTGPQGATGPQGVKGDDGADGTSFVIQDIYPTLGALKAAYPTGNEYAYQVTAEDDEIFIWSELETDWVSLGKLQGPQGPQGPAGPAGPTGATGATGPQGPQGIQGVQGPQGATGPEGPQGPAGVAGADGKSAYQSAVEAGYSGTETTFNQALVELPTVETSLTNHIGDNTKHITAAERTAWNAKQDALTFDDTPTSGSSNPVKSGGVHSALSGKQDALTFDNVPTQNSANPVKSGGVFSALAGKASVGDIGNLWVWEKFNYTPESYHDGEIVINENILWKTSTGGTETIYYSDSISVDEHGTVILINPSTLYLSYDNYSNANVLKGKYIRREVLSQVAFIPTTATFSRKSLGGYYSVQASTLTYIDGVAAVFSHVEYVSSPNSSTYPEHGQSGDYWYTRLEQIGGAARIETGSYVGTGTYGADNPNSLTFGFAPKLFSIYGGRYISLDNYQIFSLYDGNCVNPIVPFDILFTSYRRGLAPGAPENNSANSYAKKSEDGKTISWYASDAPSQNNSSSECYYYFAIG